MANLVEVNEFAENILQLEVVDRVEGGEGKVSNTQAQQLANRTRYLKTQVDNLKTEQVQLSEEVEVNSSDINLIKASRWQPSTAVELGFLRYPNEVPANNIILKCTAAGITQNIEPTWGLVGSTTVESTGVEWEVLSLIASSGSDNQGLPIIIEEVDDTYEEVWESNLINFTTSDRLMTATIPMDLSNKKYTAEVFLVNKTTGTLNGYTAGESIGQVTAFDDHYVTTQWKPIVNGNIISVSIYSSSTYTIGLVNKTTGASAEINRSTLVNSYAMYFRIKYSVDRKLKVISSGNIASVVNPTEFDSIATLIALESQVLVGTYIRTRGYFLANDGGGATYYIGPTRQFDWDIEITPDKFASIKNLDEVSYKMFGAILDGIADDEIPLQNCHAYANANNTNVRNKSGIIYKASATLIPVNTNVNLSGSLIKMTNDNSDFHSWYRIGDNSDIYFNLPLSVEQKTYLTEGSSFFPMNDNSIPSNVVIKLRETPFCVRDDAGTLYSTDRVELMVHDMFGICSGTLIEDWTSAGGRNIDTENGLVASNFEATYTKIPTNKITFVGCDVEINTTPNVYTNLMWINRHNVEIRDFTIRPLRTSLRNDSKFKNSVFHVEDCYGVVLDNIKGFNTAGRNNGSILSTSGYIIRLSNSMSVVVRNCRLQGYWGATAGENVKDIHFENCLVNRIDIHNYFRDLFINNCSIYNRGIQVGQGRGILSVTNCSYQYQSIPDYSHANKLVVLNSTYGRIFSGIINIDGLYIDAYQNGSDVDLIYSSFTSAPQNLSINPYTLPEIRAKNIYINLYEEAYKFRLLSFDGVTKGLSENIQNFKLASFEDIISSKDNIKIYNYIGAGIPTTGPSIISYKNVVGIDANILQWFGLSDNEVPTIVDVTAGSGTGSGGDVVKYWQSPDFNIPNSDSEMGVVSFEHGISNLDVRFARAQAKVVCRVPNPQYLPTIEAGEILTQFSVSDIDYSVGGIEPLITKTHVSFIPSRNINCLDRTGDIIYPWSPACMYYLTMTYRTSASEGSSAELEEIKDNVNLLISQMATVLDSSGSSGGINSQIFTANGTFTVPDGVTKIKVTCIGGAGGGGGGGAGGGSSSIGGKGATGFVNITFHDVIPGDSYLVTIGTGGNGGRALYTTGTAGGAGGATSLGTLTSASGGGGGGGGYFWDGNGEVASRYSTGANGISYTNQLTGIFPWCSIGGTSGAGTLNTYGGNGTSGALIVEW